MIKERGGLISNETKLLNSDENPTISVVMSTCNKKKFLKNSIESILKQTFINFEFIIIDDESTDGSIELIQEYTEKDDRIIFIKNTRKMGYYHNLQLGFKIAKGKYIARMDDDDISELTRLSKQVIYLEKNKHITVLGSFVDVIGDPDMEICGKNIDDPEILSVLLNIDSFIYNSSVMIRKSFLDLHTLTYNTKYNLAEDYILWSTILLVGGKVQNYPEILIHCRMHKKNIITNKTMMLARQKMLRRFFDTDNELQEFISIYYNQDNILRLPLINIIKDLSEKNIKQKVLPQCAFDKTIDKLNGCLEPAFDKNNIPVVLATDNNYFPYLGVAIASIIKTSTTTNNYDIIVLEEDIDSYRKKQLLSLIDNYSNIKIRFINMKPLIEGQNDRAIFYLSGHFTTATYYRFFIADLLKKYEKVIYIDSDVIVLDDLANLYKVNIGDNLIAAVPDVEMIKTVSAENEGIYNTNYSSYIPNILKVTNYLKYFQAGVIIFNIKELIKENFSQKCIDKLKQIKTPIIVDQDILNAVCYEQVYLLDMKWNAVWNPFIWNNHHIRCLPIDFYNNFLIAFNKPSIIHYASVTKPWSSPERAESSYFWSVARETPFYEEIIMKNTKIFNNTQSINCEPWEIVRYITLYKKLTFKCVRNKIKYKVSFGDARRKRKMRYNEIKKQKDELKAFLRI
ncbi:glycosyltransferase [Orbus sturtevantii]|uniref:glycosyltransferase n=1 Tax=Orbus sturtevantii TaxID=3074109 RepID=UPI00370D317B